MASKQAHDLFLDLYYGGLVGRLFVPIRADFLPEEGFDVEFCERVLESDPDCVEALSFLGNVYTQRGEHQRGVELDLKLVRLRPRLARAHYNLACSYALLGRPEEGLEALGRAVDCGFSDAAHMEKDKDLDALRGDTRFESLLERARTSG